MRLCVCVCQQRTESGLQTKQRWADVLEADTPGEICAMTVNGQFANIKLQPLHAGQSIPMLETKIFIKYNLIITILRT